MNTFIVILLLWLSCRSAFALWAPLDHILNSDKQEAIEIKPPITLTFEHKAGADTEPFKGLVQSIHTKKSPSAIVIEGKRIFPTYELWLEATYIKSLPSVEAVLKSSSDEELIRLFGRATDASCGYDGGGMHDRFHYFTVSPDRTLTVFLVEYELAGFRKGELRMWTASQQLPREDKP